MPARLTGVNPQPRLDVMVADPASGDPRRMTTYRGTARVDRVREQKIEVSRIPEHNQITFFLPDSLPYPAGADVTVSTTVTTSLHSVSGGNHTATGPYGLHTAAATLVDDPRGSGWRYLQVAFVNTYVGEGAEFTYEVTAITGADVPTD